MDILIGKLVVLIDLVILSMAIGSMSMTITKTEIFKTLRDSVPGWFLKKVMTCPYCLSHWLSFFAVGYYKPVIIRSRYVETDLIVSIFAVITLSSASCWLIYKAFSQMSPSDEDE